MSENWEAFVVLVAEDIENTNSPLYRLLIDHFPIQFMLKLLSMIPSNSSQVVQSYAAVLLTYHFNDILEERYSDMDTETLKTFQTHAIRLLSSESLGPEIQKCALVMMTKLLTLSLQHNLKWTDFIKLTVDAFTSGEKVRNLTLEIFCKQTVLLQHKFMIMLEPHFRIEHLDILLRLLERGDDHRPFMILPSISHMLKRDKWSRLIEGAIISPFFDNAIDPLRKCQVASALRFCIQHSAFDFSPVMVNKIGHVIFLLMQSNDDGENRMAVKLCGALLGSCFSKFEPFDT